jgi:hypothetical protein
VGQNVNTGGAKLLTVEDLDKQLNESCAFYAIDNKDSKDLESINNLKTIIKSTAQSFTNTPNLSLLD